MILKLTNKSVEKTQKQCPENKLPTPVVRIHNLTVEQAYTQEQENHTVTQGAEIKNQYRILKSLIYGTLT